ncbi:MAG TPA: hypothetical protein VJR04_04815 [Terriglobales bacterium]|nr:hypothetical protein [Terriglobales bacterium]
MATKLTVDLKLKIVYSTYYGDMTTTDLVQHIAAIRKHPDFNPDFDELIDASGVRSFDVPSDDVRELASRESPFHPHAKRVLVAPQDLVFGLGRMFQTFGNEQRPHFVVVRTLDEAYRRLGRERLPKAQ